MSPDPTEPAIERLTIQEIKHRMDEGEPLYVMDVRQDPDFTQIKGAVYYDPTDLLSAERIHLPVPSDRLIILYCNAPQEGTSVKVARKLLDQGYRQVFPMLGGYATWKRRKIGYPIEPRRLSAPRS